MDKRNSKRRSSSNSSNTSMSPTSRTAPSIFEGLLEKQSSRLPGSFMMKKYWCVLDVDRLNYYKSANKGEQCCGFIEVSRIQSVIKGNKSQIFKIVLNSGTQTFTATNGESCDQWVKALQSAMSAASQRLSMQRQSVVSCMSINDGDDDDEPMTPGESQSLPLPTDNVSPSSTSENRRETLVNDPSTNSELSEGFSYSNAADVAKSLNGENRRTRVQSVHSDEEDTVDNPQQDRPEVLPLPSALQNSSTEAVETPPAIHTDHDEMTKPDVVTEESSNSCADTDASPKDSSSSHADKKTPPLRKVTFRRDSRLMEQQQQQASSVNTPAAEPSVIEVHLDVEIKPSIVEELRHDRISQDGDSSLQKLKSFLEDNGASDVQVRSSSNLPTAIQPGKAVDSLKHFLCALE